MFRNLTIRTQLIAVIGALGILLAGVGAFGLAGMSSGTAALKTVYEDRLVPTAQLAGLREAMLDDRIALAVAQLTPTPDFVARQLERVQRNAATAARLWKDYLATELTVEEKRLAAEVGKRRDEYLKSSVEPSVAALRAGDSERMNKIAVETLRPQFAKLDETLTELARLQLKIAAEEHAAAVARYESSWRAEVGVIGGALLLAALAAYLLVRGIVRPIDRAVKLAEAVAAGDLTTRIECDGSNETGRLLKALAHMNANLAGIVAKVRVGVDTIAVASEQLASGNTDLSQRTEEQASSLEETAASMEELASTVKQNALNARNADSLASGAAQVAAKGGAVVADVVQTMDCINQSSKKIADIIGVIDGIAFQTNILALNAAVEAARAGEQGRGFAVVASEVRTLAQRSASAAKEIKDLISDSVRQVHAGAELVGNAGRTMDEIVTSVQRVTGIMSEITAAAQEQSAGIEQVNTAVMQMDQVTQQNAALVEEAAAAAESMREQASALGRAVAVFKLADAPQHQAPSVSIAATHAGNVTRLPTRPSRTAEARADTASLARNGSDGEWSAF